MTGFDGFSELRTPRDLVLKLSHDLKRLKKSPHNQYAAFDFFITAEHIIDWLYPNNKSEREKLRSSSVLLRITSHIANGAKHFEAKAKHHQSVTEIKKNRYVEAGYVEEGYSEEPLVINLTVNEAKEIGQASIEAIQLAQSIYDYWNLHAK
jgi:hypothetical protein